MTLLKCTKCGDEFESLDTFKEAYREKHGIGPIPQEVKEAKVYAKKSTDN